MTSPTTEQTIRNLPDGEWEEISRNWLLTYSNWQTKPSSSVVGDASTRCRICLPWQLYARVWKCTGLQGALHDGWIIRAPVLTPREKLLRILVYRCIQRSDIKSDIIGGHCAIPLHRSTEWVSCVGMARRHRLDRSRNADGASRASLLGCRNLSTPLWGHIAGFRLFPGCPVALQY